MLMRYEHQLADIKGLAGRLDQSTQDVLDRIREAQAELAPCPRLIAFVHIPKTAGATVKFMFANAFPRGAVRDAGNFLTHPEATATKVTTPPKGGWDAWGREGGRVTAGHVPYWLFRQHLPPRTRYMTFLRDPVERVLSHYHRHMRLTGLPKDQTKLRRGALLTATIEEALEMRPPELSNLATRFLCLFPASPGELPASALDDAKANLRDFAFVGIQERFEESIVLLQRKFDLGLVTYLNRHVSHDRPVSTDEQREKIAEHNQLDRELYEYARGLFDGAVTEAGDAFGAEVEALSAKSEATNAEAIRKARDWLLRELPVGSSKPRIELFARAERAGVSPFALKDLVNVLPLTIAFDEDGRKIWLLTEEAHESASRGDLH
jgi:hypothetical protein